MTWNWLKVAFRPLGASRHIDALNNQIEQLNIQLNDAHAEADRLRVSVMTSRETALILSRQIENFHKEISWRDKKISEMVQQVDEAKSDQLDYQQLDELITQFEQQKKDYEKRISILRLQLKDARAALRLNARPEIDELPEPVDMTASAFTIEPSSDLQSSADDRAKAADWLQQLPDNI